MNKKVITILAIFVGIVLFVLVFNYIKEIRIAEIEKNIEYLEQSTKDILIDVCAGGDPEQAITTLESIEARMIELAEGLPEKGSETFMFKNLNSVIRTRHAIERFVIDKDLETLCTN